jgi:LemA protein
VAKTVYRRELAMTALIVVLVLVVLLALWGVVSYNRLIRLRNLVQEAWRQIDVELTRRHDLIPNLVETVKGYASHERGTLEDVMKARSAAMSGGQSPAGLAQNENVLTQALGRLFAVAEAYPDLKANQNFLALQQELASTEDRIASGRRYYNANVRELNTKVESVPSNIVAGLAHIGRAEYFEAEGAERQAPQVSFGGTGAGTGQIGPGAGTAPSTPTGPQDTIRPAAPVDPPQGS